MRADSKDVIVPLPVMAGLDPAIQEQRYGVIKGFEASPYVRLLDAAQLGCPGQARA
jgi:hypothetical protein